MSEANKLKTRSATNHIPLYGGILGLVLCLLTSSVCSLSYFSATEGSSIKNIQDLDFTVPWLVMFGIFAGPLGAGVGAFVAADLFMTDEAGKKVARTLFRVCGGILGFILGFWIPIIAIFIFFVQGDSESIILGIFYSVWTGPVIGFLGAVGGVQVAKHLLKVWSNEED